MTGTEDWARSVTAKLEQARQMLENEAGMPLDAVRMAGEHRAEADLLGLVADAENRTGRVIADRELLDAERQLEAVLGATRGVLEGGGVVANTRAYDLLAALKRRNAEGGAGA